MIVPESPKSATVLQKKCVNVPTARHAIAGIMNYEDSTTPKKLPI